VFDLRDRDACREAVKDARYVFNPAADMGGMGFIETNKACARSVLINTNLLLAAQEQGIERYFFASSACVYAGKQTSAEVASLKTRMRTRRCPRTATAGRNSSTSVCAGTSRRASD
jgi:GDP-D-mannose 3',5'-epimerase